MTLHLQSTLLCLAMAAACQASTISFTGDLRTDATFTSCGAGCTLDLSNTDGDYATWAAVVQSFVVPTAATVEAITFSYGGGTNGAGTAIAQGGFEPYLSLFDSAGNFLNSTFFGVTCPAGAQTNTVSGQCFDVELDAGKLAAGTYQIAISAFENESFAENLGTGTLADGFTGLGNLAASEDLHYAFDVIISPTTVATPEPSSAWLMLGAAVAVTGISRLRKGKTS